MNIYTNIAMNIYLPIRVMNIFTNKSNEYIYQKKQWIYLPIRAINIFTNRSNEYIYQYKQWIYLPIRAMNIYYQ